MPRKVLSERDKKVKRLLLKGRSRNAISKETGIPLSTVRDIVDKLVQYGEIRAIPGTKSPVIYEDPNADKNDAQCTKKLKTTRLPDFCNPPAENESGVSTGKICPDGSVEAHVNGLFRFDCLVVGDFDDLRDVHGFVIGYWTEAKKKSNGAADQRILHVFIFGQESTAQYRQTAKGSLMFAWYPGRIYLDPRKFSDRDAALDVFVDRANYIAELLRAHGWQLKNPQMRGTFEFAVQNHPLTSLMTRDEVPPGSEVAIDDSLGVPEAELKDPDRWEKVQIWANVPGAILAQAERLEALRRDVELAEERSKAAMARLDDMEAVHARIVDVMELQEDAVLGLVERTTNLTIASTNLTAAQTQARIREVQTARDGGKPSGGQDSDSADSKNLEGYQ